ncbi:MAG: rhomboid family intramembrane serine protease [Gammaproteobacteria bacterium]|nr:MAG: rhomboid family intramembrane serine protease [Gammaproteobacteria bacterium]RLA60787.1 MAG: rhomboid family intramembrane serine protease [Gammaproteobacteria bacterium]
MSDLHTALSVNVEEDLLPLSALLHQRGVGHRIFEENGRQVVVVQHAEQAQQVTALYRDWRAGKVRIELTGKAQVAQREDTLHWRSAPVTVALILLSIGGFLLVYLHASMNWLAHLTFTPFQLVDGEPVFGSIGGQYWRLVTPVFLHFGWLHIVFNSLWLWELGAKVERVMGSLNMVLLFLVIALVSNASQFIFGGAGIFGGMSGVVYGMLGFSWVAPLFQPQWCIQPAPTLMLFMVGWLVVCMVGLVQVLGFGAIANAAHLGGLLCGCGLGAAFGLLSRLAGDKG